MKACFFLLFLVGLGCLDACAQRARRDLYNCEGCEAIYEHTFDDLSAETIIPAPDEPGERLIITGTVYQIDGKTPAPGVVLYAYHTNAQGVYPTHGNETGWDRRHGYLRGWVKTGADGRYWFDTIRPAPYPGRTDPAHIHLTVKEPDHREYWIDEIVFEGDPRLNETHRRRAQNQGGSGIIRLTRDAQGTWHGSRDIILERHPDP